MKYPESVLTRNRKGETEVRRLLEKGVFVKYDYIYPETGKKAENGKLSIILKTRKRPTAQTKEGLPNRKHMTTTTDNQAVNDISGPRHPVRSPVTDTSNQFVEEHLFLIPLKGGRFLAVRPKEGKGERGFWDPGKGKAVKL